MIETSSDAADVVAGEPPTVEAKMPEVELTDEMIQQMRELIGVELRIGHSVNNEEVTRLAVLKFASGIGDTNPLWSDADYARASVYGRPVAPPSFVICCFAGLQFGWPGLGAFHSSSDLTFHRPVFRDDRIEATCTYEGFDGPQPSSFAKQSVVDHFRNRYTNQRDELVAEIHWTVMNFERHTAKARKRDGDGNGNGVTLPHPWTEPEVREIEDGIAAEVPRGAEPRYWDDVQPGDVLDTVTKGPIGTTDEVAFVACGGAPIPRLSAHRASLLEYRRHPAWAFRDPITSALEPIYAVHYNDQAAHAMGVSMQYDVGFQRQCWHVHVLTDWMGDDAWIKSASAQYRSFVYLSDVVRLGGEVLDKYVDDDGESVVTVRTFAHNQRGADVMPGTATIALPTRAGASPVRDRVTRR